MPTSGQQLNHDIQSCSTIFFSPIILCTSQTTDLCLAQERVGQLDLGVVRNIKVLARLGQSDIQLLLETGSGRGKRTRARGGEEEKRRLWTII